MLKGLKEVRISLSKILFNFSEIASGDMIIVYEGDMLEVGINVYTYDENAEKINLPDGSYDTEIGVLVVVDGIVKEIIKQEIEVEQAAVEVEQSSDNTQELKDKLKNLEEKFDKVIEIVNSTIAMTQEFMSQSTDQKIEKKIEKKINEKTDKSELENYLSEIQKLKK